MRGWRTQTRRAGGTERLRRMAAVAAVIALVFALTPPVSGAASSTEALLAWGDNAYLQLGPGSAEAHTPTPVEVPGVDGVTQVAASDHNLALRADGTVLAWGSNEWSQLGHGDSFSGSGVPKSDPAPVVGPGRQGTLSDIVDVAAGDQHSVALRGDGTVWAWGRSNCGRLGPGNHFPQRPGFAGAKGAPVQVQPLRDIVDVDAGGAFSMALDARGVLWVWGDSAAAPGGTPQAGCTDFPLLQMNVGGTEEGLPVPVPLAEGSGDVVAFAAGSAHALALTGNGLVWSWGADCEGQLGPVLAAEEFGVTSGPSPGRGVPLPVEGLPVGDVVGVAAGGVGNGGHSLALTRDGQVLAWGLADAVGAGNGQGIASPCVTGRRGAAHPNPVAVQQAPSGSALGDVAALSAGTAHSLAITASGDLYAWGRNDRSQLGMDGATRLMAERVDLGGSGAQALSSEAETATAAAEPAVSVSMTAAHRHSLARLGSPPARPDYSFTPSPMSDIRAMIDEQLAAADDLTPEDPDELRERIEALDEELAAIQEDLDALAAEHVDPVVGEELDALQARLDELSADLEAIRDEVERGDLDGLRERLLALADQGSALREDVDRQAAEVLRGEPLPPQPGPEEPLEGTGVFVTTLRSTDTIGCEGDFCEEPHPENAWGARYTVRRAVQYVTEGSEAQDHPPRLLYVAHQSGYRADGASGQEHGDVAGMARPDMFSHGCPADDQPTGRGCFDVAYDSGVEDAFTDGPERVRYLEDEWDARPLVQVWDSAAGLSSYDAVIVGARITEKGLEDDFYPRHRRLYDYVNAGGGVVIFGGAHGDYGDEPIGQVCVGGRRASSKILPFLEGEIVCGQQQHSVTPDGRDVGFNDSHLSHQPSRKAIYRDEPGFCPFFRPQQNLGITGMGTQKQIPASGEGCEEPEDGDNPSPVPDPDRDNPTEGLPELNHPNTNLPVNLPNQLPSVNVSPGGSPGGAPGGAPGGSPAAAPGGAPGGSPAAAPGGAAPSGSPGTAPGSPAAAPGGAPAPAPGMAPGTAFGMAPGAAFGTAPGTAFGTAPAPGTASAPGTAPGTATGQAPGSAPGAAPSPAVGQAPGGAGVPSVAPAPAVGSAAPGAAQAPGSGSAALGGAEAVGERDRQPRVEFEEAPVEAGHTKADAAADTAPEGGLNAQRAVEFHASTRQSSPAAPLGAAAAALAAGLALGWRTRRMPTGGEPAYVRVPASDGPSGDAGGESEEWLARRRGQR